MKAEFTLKLLQWNQEQSTPKTHWPRGNEPHAVLDENVHRIMARYFGISTPVDTAEGKDIYHQLAQALLDTEAPAVYNQALLDFAQAICKPEYPLCQQCVQQPDCEAYKHGFVDMLPVKKKKEQGGGIVP